MTHSTLTALDFTTKLAVVFGPLILAGCYILLYAWHRGPFVYFGVEQEKEAVNSEKGQEGIKVAQLQTGPWPTNANLTQGHSGTTVGSLLVVVTLLVQTELDRYREIYLDLIVAIVGFACLFWSLAMQFWNTALDRYAHHERLLKHRKIATSLQVAGWYGLLVSVLMCVALVHTWLGLALATTSAAALCAAYRVKHVSSDPA